MKTFEKILKSITTKWTQTENKQVIVGFGHWSNPRDSFIRGHQRGPVKEVKDKLQKMCEVVDVDKFWVSKLCCHCHSETVKVQNGGKEINSVLHCSNNKCGITIDHDVNGTRNMYVLLTKVIHKEKWPEAFCHSKNMLFSMITCWEIQWKSSFSTKDLMIISAVKTEWNKWWVEFMLHGAYSWKGDITKRVNSAVQLMCYGLRQSATCLLALGTGYGLTSMYLKSRERVSIYCLTAMHVTEWLMLRCYHYPKSDTYF
jgi:hypothetical protein